MWKTLKSSFNLFPKQFFYDLDVVFITNLFEPKTSIGICRNIYIYITIGTITNINGAGNSRTAILLTIDFNIVKHKEFLVFCKTGATLKIITEPAHTTTKSNTTTSLRER